MRSVLPFFVTTISIALAIANVEHRTKRNTRTHSRDGIGIITAAGRPQPPPVGAGLEHAPGLPRRGQRSGRIGHRAPVPARGRHRPGVRLCRRARCRGGRRPQRVRLCAPAGRVAVQHPAVGHAARRERHLDPAAAHAQRRAGHHVRPLGRHLRLGPRRHHRRHHPLHRRLRVPRLPRGRLARHLVPPHPDRLPAALRPRIRHLWPQARHPLRVGHLPPRYPALRSLGHLLAALCRARPGGCRRRWSDHHGDHCHLRPRPHQVPWYLARSRQPRLRRRCRLWWPARWRPRRRRLRLALGLPHPSTPLPHPLRRRLLQGRHPRRTRQRRREAQADRLPRLPLPRHLGHPRPHRSQSRRQPARVEGPPRRGHHCRWFWRPRHLHPRGEVRCPRAAHADERPLHQDAGLCRPRMLVHLHVAIFDHIPGAPLLFRRRADDVQVRRPAPDPQRHRRIVMLARIGPHHGAHGQVPPHAPRRGRHGLPGALPHVLLATRPHVRAVLLDLDAARWCGLRRHLDHQLGRAHCVHRPQGHGGRHGCHLPVPRHGLRARHIPLERRPPELPPAQLGKDGSSAEDDSHDPPRRQIHPLPAQAHAQPRHRRVPRLDAHRLHRHRRRGSARLLVSRAHCGASVAGAQAEPGCAGAAGGDDSRGGGARRERSLGTPPEHDHAHDCIARLQAPSPPQTRQNPDTTDDYTCHDDTTPRFAFVSKLITSPILPASLRFPPLPSPYHSPAPFPLLGPIGFPSSLPLNPPFPSPALVLPTYLSPLSLLPTQAIPPLHSAHRMESPWALTSRLTVLIRSAAGHLGMPRLAYAIRLPSRAPSIEFRIRGLDGPPPP